MLERVCRHLCWLNRLQEKLSPLALVLHADQDIAMSALASLAVFI